jgi:hypothetical protein
MEQNTYYYSNRFHDPADFQQFLKDCERFQPHLNRYIAPADLEKGMDIAFEEEPVPQFLIVPDLLSHICPCQICYFNLTLGGKRVWSFLD